MKKSWIIAIAIAAIVIACIAIISSYFSNSPKGYARKCIVLMDKLGYYSETPEWKEAKASAQKEVRNLDSLSQAHEFVASLIKVAGGKHSFLAPPVKDTATYEEFPPEAYILDNNILYIKLTGHSGVKVSDSLYIHTVLDVIGQAADAKGVVIDLQDNDGGNMYPMMAAVSPFLPEGEVICFSSKNPRKKQVISKDRILMIAHLSPEFLKTIEDGMLSGKLPIAILTDDNTASSGEATLLAFRGMDNVKTFGGPTAGYASANVPIPLSDGYRLVITVGGDIARTGETFCDDPIDPDVRTDNALADAIEWILE